MPLLSARCAVVGFCLVLFLASSACAQTNYYAASGTEFPIIGSLPGDQVYPDVALNKNGGYIVWQDNITDPSGVGISAMQVNSTLSGSGDVFAVNTITTNNQERARVALLKNGGAAFVWQGGPENIQHIYGRFLNASNLWTTTTNVAISTFANSFQSSPAVATLANGNVIVVWASFNQAGSGSLDDVYGQLLSTNGTPIGTNFLINVVTAYNQRSPAVAALTNGGFVVAWVSEQQRMVGVTNSETNSIDQIEAYSPSVDIYERLYTNSGSITGPSTGEILVDQDNEPCAAPAIATATDGSYMVTWCANDNLNVLTNGWDIFARSFTNANGGPVIAVNSYTYGDQYNPRISVIDGDYLIVWTSLGQDGSREGVYGQFVHENGGLIGGEFLVNTTTVGQQMEPAVTSDGNSQFLAVWTSFTFGPNSFDLYAQRYVNVQSQLAAMPAPYVWAPFVISNGVYQPQLVVTWAPVVGFTNLSNYQIFVDGATTNMASVSGSAIEWTMTAANGLTPSSTHTFATEYVTSQGFVSPISAWATNSTWIGLSWGGIPYEWMNEFFGGYYGGVWHTGGWPPANEVPPGSPAGSPTLLQLFLTGGIPYEPSTWLQMTLTPTARGMYLSWNTQPGMTYQVQTTTNFQAWSDYGSPRFESGTNDTINVGKGSGSYYRIQLLQP